MVAVRGWGRGVSLSKCRKAFYKAHTLLSRRRSHCWCGCFKSLNWRDSKKIHTQQGNKTILSAAADMVVSGTRAERAVNEWMSVRRTCVPHVSVYKGSYALQKHINCRQCKVKLAKQFTHSGSGHFIVYYTATAHEKCLLWLETHSFIHFLYHLLPECLYSDSLS